MERPLSQRLRSLPICLNRNFHCCIQPLHMRVFYPILMSTAVAPPTNAVASSQVISHVQNLSPLPYQQNRYHRKINYRKSHFYCCHRIGNIIVVTSNQFLVNNIKISVQLLRQRLSSWNRRFLAKNFLNYPLPLGPPAVAHTTTQLLTSRQQAAPRCCFYYSLLQFSKKNQEQVLVKGRGSYTQSYGMFSRRKRKE